MYGRLGVKYKTSDRKKGWAIPPPKSNADTTSQPVFEETLKNAR
jgi:hypothetical protein